MVSPDVLNTSQCTEYPSMYWTYIIQGDIVIFKITVSRQLLCFRYFLKYSCSNLFTCINFHKNLMESRWGNIHLALIGERQWTATLLINYRWSKVTGFECQYDSVCSVSLVQHRPVVVVQWLAHLTGIFRVSGPAPWGGGGGGGWGTISTYVLILYNFYCCMCTCWYMSCVNIYLLLFFLRELFTMNHLVFFPEVKLES